MKRPSSREIAVFVLLVTLGVFARVWFQDIPNFAPIAALALFAGYYFASRTLAVAAPLTVLLISDRLIDAGGYAFPLMVTVYVLLTLPVFFQRFLRRHLSFEQGSTSRVAGSVVGLLGCSLACSIVFFLGTNFMVWMTSSWYEPTVAGLLRCYVSAIPFFRYTLAGDATFGALFFGCYAAVTMMLRSTNRKLIAAN